MAKKIKGSWRKIYDDLYSMLKANNVEYPQFLANRIIRQAMRMGLDPDTFDVEEIDPQAPLQSLEEIARRHGKLLYEDIYIPEDVADALGWRELWKHYREHLESHPEFKHKRVLRRVFSQLERRT